MYKINYEAHPSYNDIKKIDDGIFAYAKQQKNHKPIEEFVFFVRDNNNQVVGGCSGAVFYGCLYVDGLWMQESLRGQGYGTQLMSAAEELGKERGCTFATVNTMDWEGLGFYQKLGYEIEFERHGFDKDSIFYFLRKSLENSKE